jgi:uncharacterized protein GlcG (DUF336 family)
MNKKQISEIVEKIFEQLDILVPIYKADPIDWDISKGFASVCILDENGQQFGRLWGDDKIRLRDSFTIAWKKANQVWITGYKTNEYEKLVFADKVDHGKYGVQMPDFIGWEGGQPITLADGTKLSVGFSGFRGTSDIEIVLKACAQANIDLQ